MLEWTFPLSALVEKPVYSCLTILNMFSDNCSSLLSVRNFSKLLPQSVAFSICGDCAWLFLITLFLFLSFTFANSLFLCMTTSCRHYFFTQLLSPIFIRAVISVTAGQIFISINLMTGIKLWVKLLYHAIVVILHFVILYLSPAHVRITHSDQQKCR